MLLGSRGPFEDGAPDGPDPAASSARTAPHADVASALAVADWRERVAELYAEVRRTDDPADAHARWAQGRDRLFRDHPASAVPPAERAGFGGLRVAPYDPAFRFEVEVRPAPKVPWLVETGTDGTVAFERLGSVELGALGSLDVWWLTSYGGGLFVPLRDATSGRTTYGGGRYVLDTVKGADLGVGTDRLVVDLNFAYAPSCAYDAAWACPLAPPGNTLSVEVPVGELTAR